MDAGRLEALLSVPVLTGPVVSPDGGWVAWNWSRLGPATDVYGAPTDGSRPPVRLTGTPDDTHIVSWTPDSAAVIVGQDRDGDERTQLFRVRLEKPGDTEPLTEASPHFYIRGGQLHPNGRWLVYAANLDTETGEEIEASRVYRQDLVTGERRVLARPARGNFHRPLLNATGTHVLYLRNDLHPAGLQVWLVDIEGRADREILNFGPATKVYASWFPEGDRILFVVESETHRRLGVLDIRSGSARWLLDDPARNLEYAFTPPNGGPVVVVETENSNLTASFIDADPTATSSLPEPPALPGNLVPLAPTKSGSWAGLHYSAQSPPDLLRVSSSGEPSSLTGLWDRTPLAPEALVPAEDFRWPADDGLEIQGWLYRAPRPGAGTIVMVHGGPTSRSEDRFNAQAQYLASRGFNVLAPNYRGSTGFGMAFQESIKADGWGGREQDDIRAGIEALIREGLAEPGKVGVTGTSYGGYSAWCAITRYPRWLVAAAAPVCGMTDLVVDYYSTRPDLRPYSEEMMGGSPEEVPDLYRARSPINFVRNIEGEVLIVQGLKDPNVTPENVEVVVRELERHNVACELLTFADEGHGISRTKNLKVLYPRLADFFGRAFRPVD
ncbi:MAG: alpha/beta fold hydrolase [Actinomycetota bacterium]|nr:alpha/beta fold hydrolase [Actinomycetota bacterium]